MFESLPVILTLEKPKLHSKALIEIERVVPLARHVVAAQILVGLVHNKGAARLQPWLPYERACWRQQEKLCPQACMPADSCVSMGKALLPNCSFLTVETGITTSNLRGAGKLFKPLGKDR